MIVHTETGSVYDINQADNTVKRLPDPDGGQLRKDNEVVPLLSLIKPVIGEPMTMLIDVRGDGVQTVRHTSPVTKIEA